MATTVTCPSCGRSLSLPQDVEGLRVQCPTCGTRFEAPPAIPAPLTRDEAGSGSAIPNLPPPPRPFVVVLVDSSHDPVQANAAEEEDFERCPMCKRRVPADVDICPACGTDLDTRRDEDGSLRGPPRRDYEPHRAALISALGAASILFGVIAALALCAGPFALAGLIGGGIGAAALIMAKEDLDQMDRNIMDPDGRRQTVAGKTNATIGTILSLIGLLAGGLHALVFLGKWL